MPAKLITQPAAKPAPKAASSSSSSSSSDSDSDSDSEEDTGKRARVEDSDSEPDPQPRMTFAKTPAPKRSSAQYDLPQPQSMPPAGRAGTRFNQTRRNTPKMSRIDVDRYKVEDNSYEGLRGNDTYGRVANRDFSGTSGKSFRAAKTKKKRGSYAGGRIDQTVRSIPL
ncbi:SRP40, C-terminal domain [Carpediemonas membranifera]|uniref:SRP40, C-terminal domain n=1 Tax=Carpediemonas membranifera TaxID=201153 RepID=A0A8J6AU36_9EUKA|nr:SRP40, C-terminal domain [Carpediemonas membranifera]|eukprot:KAG9394726.1 SRP40, C-terminal domain [Carpediemonas membranifera]